MLVYYIEDDLNTVDVIKRVLLDLNLNVKGFKDGSELIKHYYLEKPDLLIFDIQLLDMSGLDLLKEIRLIDSYIPVIVISSLTNEIDKVMALDLGADDYITKPFSVLELSSRIRAKLRRVQSVKVITFEKLVIDLKKQTTTYNNISIKLTKKEFDLLRYLLLNKETVLSKEMIFLNVWNSNFIGESRTLDIHIKKLREKLRTVDANIEIITIFGVGYSISLKEN